MDDGKIKWYYRCNDKSKKKGNELKRPKRNGKGRKYVNVKTWSDM